MNILELVKNFNRIGISGHESPDGDCVGSCCGLALYLRKAMPSAQIDIYLEHLPGVLERNIPGTETIRHEVPEFVEKYDAFIVLDCMPDRTGEAVEKLYKEAPFKINIDHHKTNPGFGEVFYVNAGASSTCELVYETIDSTMIDRDIAQALYVGIVTDTGVFQYSNTGESTMKIAGELISYGFDFTSVIREVFFERTYVQSKLLGLSLVNAERILDGKCLICLIDRETMNKLGASKSDLEGISAQLLLTEGADCSVFLHETEKGVWRASMRSFLTVDVAKTASLFGGGGHTRAAGCTIRIPIDEAVKILKEDIANQLGITGKG